MSPTKKVIRDLTEKSKDFSLKLKVVQKWRPVYSPNRADYQKYIMRDEEGEEISDTVFDHDIKIYDAALQQNRDYEISTATLRLVKEQYRRKPNELEMKFTPSTVIRPLFPEVGATSGINYVDISSIDFDAANEDLYDVLGVVLYLEPNRTVKKRTGSLVDVRDLVIMDHSVSRPVVIAVWGDLAADGCSQLSDYVGSTNVIGITLLKVSSFKASPLGTSLSTQFILDPTGEKAIAMANWAASNKQLIEAEKKTS